MSNSEPPIKALRYARIYAIVKNAERDAQDTNDIYLAYDKIAYIIHEGDKE